MSEIISRQKRKVINFGSNSKAVILTEEIEHLGSPESVKVTIFDDRNEIVITKNDD